MTDLRDAARQALEALENGRRVRACEGGTKYQPPLEEAAITALRAALEQPEQEVKGCDHCNHPLYAAIKCRVCGRVRAETQRDELLQALKDATDAIEHWGTYATDYFQKKWDLQSDINAARAAIARAEGQV